MPKLLIRLWNFSKRHKIKHKTQLCLIIIGGLKLVFILIDKIWNRAPNADFRLNAVTVSFSSYFNFLQNLLDQMIWMFPHLVKLLFQIKTRTMTYTVCPFWYRNCTIKNEQEFLDSTPGCWPGFLKRHLQGHL